MKIGFIRESTVASEMSNHCEVLVYASNKEIMSQLGQFVADYHKQTLVFLSLTELGLQLTQLLPVLEAIAAHGTALHIVDKGELKTLSDGDYLKVLLTLARQEQEVVRLRTASALEKARGNGKDFGRALFDQDKIAQIRYN